jgi:hypothetical protein
MTERRFSLPKTAVFLMGVFCGVVALALYIGQNKSGADTDIILPDKSIYDNADDVDGFVSIQGTLTGEGLLHTNNVIRIWCYQSKMQCSALHIDQIGNNQIGDIDEPILLSVVKWDRSIIVATDSNATISYYPVACIKTTLNIERSKDGDSGEWIEEPINPTLPECKHTPTAIRKWPIESPPSWKR